MFTSRFCRTDSGRLITALHLATASLKEQQILARKTALHQTILLWLPLVQVMVEHRYNLSLRTLSFVSWTATEDTEDNY
ncbi:hypothetical protein L798_09933 [Zootermopsis nevadensis]|uniref:Uncharacterized protein n=1 Tax=Zootermopsis nevadensis TaxID=136037 RepID=A0A067R6U7_ZOONE|nr:hypothetical protein L798_09933 [Zootermopsis nevadensis]